MPCPIQTGLKRWPTPRRGFHDLPGHFCPTPAAAKAGTREKRGSLGKLRAAPAHSSNSNDKSNGLTPADAIQKDDAPLARRTAIQTNEGESKTRPAMFARIDSLRIEIRKLAEDVALAADIELLDLMRDEIGSYSRHKAGQEARTWAGTASIQLETGLMMLDRALRPVSNGELRCHTPT
jgi:hypothetical protein